MAVFDARPSPFTQLTTMGEWERFFSLNSMNDAVDQPGDLVASFDVPGRNIVMSAGAAIVRGQMWRCDAPVSTAIPAASASNRIDRLVLRFNRSAVTSATVIVPTIITGTPSGSPVLPPLVNTPTGLWDFPICFWTSQSNGALSALTDDRSLIANDPWHYLTFPAGWGTAPQLGYRMTRDRDVVFQGSFQLASSGSYNNITLFTLPVIYRPLYPVRIPVVTDAPATYGNNGSPPHLLVYDDGHTVLWGFPSAINSQVVFVSAARFALDVNA